MLEQIQNVSADWLFYFYQYIDRYRFLVPLGFIGMWRWSVWVMKEISGLHYHPKKTPYYATVSIVTPVYNENPAVFTQALASWEANRPSEIIAVIDHTDKTCIDIFKAFAKRFKGAKLIVTDIPGKRPALALGIEKAKSEIIALVDSDTIWAARVLKNGLCPFHDVKVAGVATYQSVLNPKTFAQKIFDAQLDLRYRHEYPFLAATGNALVCLSGRTAFYRRSVIVPMLPDLVHETFLGTPVISGDDKRLTYLVLAAGWKVAYQSNAHVYTPGMEDMGSYLKQRLRWTRNSLRADLKAIAQGWPLRHPSLFFFQIDKLLQSFIVILSPIFFFVSLYYHLWIAAVVIFCWWFLSRTIKLYPHLHDKKHHITIVPGYVFYSFLTGIVKIYALFTLNTQGWITRWDKSRMPQLRFLTVMPAYAGTALVLVALTYVVSLYKQQLYIFPQEEHDQLVASVLKQFNVQTNTVVLGSSTSTQKDLLTQRYVVVQGDTLETIAQKFGVDVMQIYYANVEKLPNAGFASVGTVLSIPGKDMQLTAPLHPHIVKTFPEPLQYYYDPQTHTIVINGRGQTIKLADIQKQFGNDYLEEVSPKIWHLKVSLMIYKGLTLTIDKEEANWLRIESNKERYIAIRSWDGDILIKGVKVTSWDSQKNDYDRNLDDGRSFVMVKDNSRLDIYDSEMAYLGFATNDDLSVSPYGVSWKLSTSELKKVLLGGEVVNSHFHDNYFGAYTYGATGMLWKGNEFSKNVRYGLDPHDDSNGFLVEENIAHDNGTHGIIFSKRCMYNTIRNNISYNNKLHGIMLHEKSNHNVIENNTFYGNTSGVALWRSSDNIVRNNKIDKNRHGVRANMSSDNNIIVSNSINTSSRYGVYFYDNANNNTVEKNDLAYNEVAMYIKSNSNTIQNNTLSDNNIGIYLLDSASKNVLAKNTIRDSKVYGVYSKVVQNVSNSFGSNALFDNRKDVTGKSADDF